MKRPLAQIEYKSPRFPSKNVGKGVNVSTGVKRGRGRPKKEFIEVVSNLSVKKKRGRPRKEVKVEAPHVKPRSVSKTVMRRRLISETKKLRSEAKRQSSSSKLDFYPHQVDLACEMAVAWLEGKHRNLLLYLPPQAGKTGATLVTWLLFKAMFIELNGSQICGADYRSLRSQQKSELERHGLRVLSRGERLNIPKVSTPYIVFIDETHYGDGAGMTIDQFLDRNLLKIHPNVILIGVSATPFSCASRLHTIRMNIEALESMGYNSPRMMRRTHRLIGSTPLVRKIGGVEEVDLTSDGWREIVQNILKKRRGGYCLIRLRLSTQARALEAKIKETFDSGFFVEHWEQSSKDFQHTDAFAKKGSGIFTIVLIVQMARMGVVIDTTHMRFMYEYSPASPVETLVQSLVGRACGYGKQEHKTKIYTHLEQIDAYIHFTEWKLPTFYEELDLKKLKISRRAQVGTDVIDGGIRELPRIELADNLTDKEVAREIRDHCSRLGLRNPVKRTMSANMVRDIESRNWAPEGTIPDLSVRSEIGGYFLLCLRPAQCKSSREDLERDRR